MRLRTLQRIVSSFDLYRMDVDIPNRRLPSRAYAFFRAAVFHLRSVKSLDNNFCVDACSRFQAAILHRPMRIFFFLRAR